MSKLLNKMLEFKPQVTLTNGKREQIVPLAENSNGIFCQHYLYFAKFECPSQYGSETIKEMHDFVTRKFVLPQGMSVDDAFRVLSFLTKHVEKKYNYSECSEYTVQRVDELIENFNFRHIEKEGESVFDFVRTNDQPCTHLFTVNGNSRYFKHSKYAKNYVEWFYDTITYKEVKDIYAKLGYQVPGILQAALGHVKGKILFAC